MTAESWRCPLCNALAESARIHLADVHGVGSDRDRLGQRDALRRQTPPSGRDDDASDAEYGRGASGDGLNGDGRDDRPNGRGENGNGRSGKGDPGPLRSPSFEPPIWRRVSPTPSRPGRPTGPARPTDDSSSEPGLTWRRARRPSSSRRSSGDAADTPPSRPIPLPPDAAVLRIVCETLDGVDAGLLRDRLLELSGVESVALDLYARTVDLYLDRTRATPPHLVAMVRERIRLPVRGAELHRAAQPGQSLGSGTLLFVIQ